MSKPTKENITIVADGFKSFFDHVVETQNFDLNEFVNFMEPRFKAAGYREEFRYNVNDDSEGEGSILILCDAGVGDFVLQSATIREIRRVYPDSHITLVAPAGSFNLAECCPYIDELLLSHQAYEHTLLNEFYYSALFANNLLKKRFDI